MLYLGIDLHRKQVTVCLRDAKEKSSWDGKSVCGP